MGRGSGGRSSHGVRPAWYQRGTGGVAGVRHGRGRGSVWPAAVFGLRRRLGQGQGQGRGANGGAARRGAWERE